MRSGHKLWITGLLFALLSAQAVAGEKQWVEVRSKNFSLITDAGEKRGRAVLLRFEQMRAAFATIFQRAKVNIPVPLQIIAFDSGKELMQYTPIWKGKPVELAGLFQGGEDRSFIAIDVSSEAGWPIVFHEYAHMLLNGNLPPSPLWFDEGYAEYCSSLTVSNKEIEFGKIPEHLPEVLQQNHWMKTVDLFSVQHSSKEYNEQDHRSVFYAQSWLTVHYIMEKRLGVQLDSYLNQVRNQVPVAEAIQHAFGMEPAKLDRTLQDYFRVGVMKFIRLPAPANLDGGPYDARPITALDAQAVLADLHYHSLDHRDQGIEEFKQILQRDPDNVLANRGLGYSLLQKNDLEGAAGYIRRAAAKDDADARLHYFHAMLLYRSGVGSRDTARNDEIRTELQKAIAIDPNYADAYSLLAFTDATRGDLTAAVQNARKAVELNPRAEPLQMNLASAQMQARDWEGAKATLTPLKSSSTPAIAAQAENQMGQLAAMQEALSRPESRAEPGDAGPVEIHSRESAPKRAVDTRPIKFLKGKLTAVDCTASPAAVLSITAQTKRWQLRVEDTDKLVVIGADKFSCGWKDQKVAVNYRASGESGGDIISLEIQ